MSNPFYECFPPNDQPAAFPIVREPVLIFGDDLFLSVSPPFRSHAIGFGVMGAHGSEFIFGTGTLSGITKVQGTPSARRVEIYDQTSLYPIKEVMSGVDGVWSASGLPSSRPLRIIVRGNTGERDVTISNLYAWS